MYIFIYTYTYIYIEREKASPRFSGKLLLLVFQNAWGVAPNHMYIHIERGVSRGLKYMFR